MDYLSTSRDEIGSAREAESASNTVKDLKEKGKEVKRF